MTMTMERKKALPSPMQELEQLEVQMQYADTMSLSDSCLRMRPDRIFQVREETNKVDCNVQWREKSRLHCIFTTLY